MIKYSKDITAIYLQSERIQCQTDKNLVKDLVYEISYKWYDDIADDDGSR